METLKAIEARKSVRGFTSEKITDEELNIILKAGNAAPIGMGRFDDIAFNVIEDRQLLDKISAAAVKGTEREGKDIYYGAQTVVVVSSLPQASDALTYANGGTILENFLLAATDIGVDSVFIFGTVRGFDNEPGLLKEAGIPEGHKIISSAALGHGMPEAAGVPKKERNITINR